MQQLSNLSGKPFCHWNTGWFYLMGILVAVDSPGHFDAFENSIYYQSVGRDIEQKAAQKLTT